MKKTGGFVTKIPKNGTKTEYLAGIPGAVCIAAGMMGLLSQRLIPALAAAGFAFALCLIAKKNRHLAFAACGAVVLCLCILFPGDWQAGFAREANRVASWLSGKTGQIILPFEAGQGSGRSFLLALSLMIALLSACGGMASALGFWMVGCLGCAVGVFSQPLWLVLIALGDIFRMFPGQRKLNVKVLLTVCICTAAALAAVPLALALPDSTAEKHLLRQFHAICYDHDTNSMPEGKLDSLGAWQPSDTPALTLTMETPQKLYLRGFVGETYTDEGWEAASPADGDDGLFYWLHADGFFAQSQIARALALTGVTETAQLTIHNESACSARRFLPYALAGNDVLDSMRMGDADCRASGTDAQLSYAPGSVPEWYAAQNVLAQRQNEPEIAAYLNLENAYRDYVYAKDLQLTPQAANAAARLLGDYEGNMTLAEIRQTILDRLDAAATYDPTVRTMNGSVDFSQYFAVYSTRGYSVHYATAAVLMLRYCGVPARYAEGYFLPAAEAENHPGGEITLTEAYAHAWAEYYLDGVGWVPFEVTPPYRDQEEQALSGVPADKRYENTQLPPPPVEQPELSQNQKPQTGWHFLQPWMAAVIPAIVLLLPAAAVLYRRRKLCLARRAMEQAQPREAVIMYYGYLLALRDGCGVEADLEEAAALNRLAQFSSHPVDEDQKAKMRRMTEELIAQCKKMNLFRRLNHRLVKTLY